MAVGPDDNYRGSYLVGRFLPGVSDSFTQDVVVPYNAARLIQRRWRTFRARRNFLYMRPGSLYRNRNWNFYFSNGRFPPPGYYDNIW